MNRKVAVRMTISEIKIFCRLAMVKNISLWKRGRCEVERGVEVVRKLHRGQTPDDQALPAGGLEFCNLRHD